MEIVSIHETQRLIESEVRSMLVRAFHDLALKMVTGSYTHYIGKLEK
jgi:hypothetical protein